MSVLIVSLSAISKTSSKIRHLSCMSPACRCLFSGNKKQGTEKPNHFNACLLVGACRYYVGGCRTDKPDPRTVDGRFLEYLMNSSQETSHEEKAAATRANGVAVIRAMADDRVGGHSRVERQAVQSS
ncbi:hypothetical protein NKJ26_12915 [Mesorhizobium sp. M0152]|uniref:hypothetical protein n=1 Tax=Mesorhizobium sp. M0152 TaxID=2956898 RepID=UPI003334AACA